jgi:MYXO-CTERM domain-containing protein
MKVSSVSFASLATCFLGLSSISAPAALWVYEPFDYNTGALAGQSGATGLDTTTGWFSSGSNQQSVTSPGLAFTGLSTTGNAAERTSAPGGAHSGIALTSAAQIALTQSGSSMYFTFLVRTDRFSQGNENFTFAFGTDSLDTATGSDGGNQAAIGGTGNGFGFSINPVSNVNWHFHGYQSVGGTQSISVDSFNSGTSAATFLVAGQIDWVGSGNDTLSLFNITDPTATSAPAAFATLSVDFDQTAFDTISFESRQITVIDEIRMGTSWSDVGLAIPEPSAVLLGGLGALFLLRRRRDD